MEIYIPNQILLKILQIINSDFNNKQNNSNDEQSLVTVKDSRWQGQELWHLDIARNQAVKSNQNQSIIAEVIKDDSQQQWKC